MSDLNISCNYPYILAFSNIICLITFPLHKETKYMQMYEKASIVHLLLCLRALYEVSVITGAFDSNSISPKIATITSKRKQSFANIIDELKGPSSKDSW